MPYLIITSIIWAFSFGLIKKYLAGVDSSLVSFIRLSLSFVFFLPFLKVKMLNKKLTLHMITVGLIQYGLMYLSYIAAYKYLQAYQVALFTIFTPFFVTIVFDCWSKRFNINNLLISLLAIVGTFVIVYKTGNFNSILTGFLLVQISNLSFAFGQVYYRKIMNKNNEVQDIDVFALLYLGGVLITAFSCLIFTEWSLVKLTEKQIFVLIFLGVIASGIGFFLWNIGARKVKIGTLSVFNNIKIPLAIIVSISVFSERLTSVGYIKLAIGSLIIGIALFLSEYISKKQKLSEE